MRLVLTLLLVVCSAGLARAQPEADRDAGTPADLDAGAAPQAQAGVADAAEVDAGVAQEGDPAGEVERGVGEPGAAVIREPQARPPSLRSVPSGPNQDRRIPDLPRLDAKPELEKDNSGLNLVDPSEVSGEQAEEPATEESETDVVATVVEDLPIPAAVANVPFAAWPLMALLLLLGVLMLLSLMVRRGREALPDRGFVPMFMRGLHVGLRLLVFILAMVISFRVLAPAFQSTLAWIVIAAAAAFGWSLSYVLPDVVAAVVMFFERRVRAGLWISGDGFEGVVERRGLRAVWIRDSDGDPVAVPNQRVLKTVLLTREGVRGIHELVVRLPANISAQRARSALRDAVLLSPWVRPVAQPVIQREPQDVTLWRVRASLLDHRYASRFEGELLERVEDLLRTR